MSIAYHTPGGKNILSAHPYRFLRDELCRKELITSVAAGKSFSLAANVQGQMFAWGTGWTGQLGLGVARDSKVRRVSAVAEAPTGNVLNTAACIAASLVTHTRPSCSVQIIPCVWVS